MVTTAVFAEIIIGGLEAEAWLLLLVLGVFGRKSIDLGTAHDWVALITLLVVAAAYVLGVVVDRIADSLLVRFLSSTLRARPVDKPANVERMRMRLLSNDDATARFLDYQRSRMRVARATVLNLGVTLPVLVFFLLRQTTASALGVVAAALIVCAAETVAAVVYRGIEFAYMCRLSEAYRLTEGLPETDIAAAVCCRRRTGGFEFAIVRTLDGRLWTFPKGHRKGNETLPEAARREACEEAGIEGNVIGNRLCAYRYPPTRPGRRDDDWVAAFLLRAARSRTALESRELKWCGFEEARALLAADRDTSYAEGMEQALIAAEEVAEASE